MKALPESRKLKDADKFCATLVRALKKDEHGNEQITDDEKNKVFRDIEELKVFTNGQKWQELITYFKSVEHLPDEKEKVEKVIIAFIKRGLRSEVIKEWVKLHLKKDFLNVLEVSLRRFNNYVLPITIEVPNFVNLEETFKYKKTELPRKDFIVQSVLENLPNRLKMSNKVVVIKYEIISYGDNFSQEFIDKQERFFDSLILKPFGK